MGMGDFEEASKTFFQLIKRNPDYYKAYLGIAMSFDKLEKYSDAIINGVKAKDFPALPVDYGYRDSKNFWFHRKTRMRAELLQMRQASLESVRYAADRVDDQIKFTDDALMTILGVPRVFLTTVLKGCVEWAKENNVDVVTAEHMKIINDKRSKEKNKKK